MEKAAGACGKDEPKLIPGWLRPANGGGTAGSGHHAASSSSSHLDEHGSGRSLRNRFSVSACDQDAPRTSPRSASSFRRSSSSNGSMSHDKNNGSRVYSNFGRGHRDRSRDVDLDPRDRDRPFLLDSYDSLFPSRNGKDSLRRTQSMVSGKRVESWPRRQGNDQVTGVLSGASVIGGRTKATFDRDFPSLGPEEKQGPPEIGSVVSPGLSSAVQSFSLGSSAINRAEAWTSALAQIPPEVGGNGSLLPSPLLTATGTSLAVPNNGTGLNMAETLAQAPIRVRNDPQLSVDTQKIEELTRRQCVKLIPMTPTMPKSSVLNSSDKAKLKGSRSDLIGSSKILQQSTSQPVNHTFRMPARSDIPKASQSGNFQVLNRERNGTCPNMKDGHSPTSGSRAVNPLVSSATAFSLKNSVDPRLKSDGKGHAPASVNSFGDKRPISHAQNRNDFFNALRKKSSMNHLSANSQPISSSSTEKVADETTGGDPVNQEFATSLGSGLECVKENGNFATGVSGPSEESDGSSSDNGEKALYSDPVVDPEEKAFLESLGWNAGEDAGEDYLTFEEITGFIAEYQERMPSSKLCQLQQIAVNEFGVPSVSSEKET